MNVIMHSADISNPTKPYAVYKQWARAVMEEFFAQGDMEKANDMPVSPMMDRDNTSLPVSQVNFIEFVVTPLYRHLYKLFPQLEPMMVHLVRHRSSPPPHPIAVLAERWDELDWLSGNVER